MGWIRAKSELHGFVFAVTGALYTDLARRAARNLRAVMPDANIDIFTDQPLTDPVFSQIHQLSDSFFRPKIEAMRRARFDRTVYLDADIVVLTAVPELFAAVDDAEIAACIGLSRQPRMMADPTIPRSFPVLNAGVIVIRRTRTMLTFLAEWEDMLRKTGVDRDQGVLRSLLYKRRIALRVLPPEYNVIHLAQLDVWLDWHGAPRILHIQALHSSPILEPMGLLNPFKILHPKRAERLKRALELEGASPGNWYSSFDQILSLA